jgi:hypothetical protein
VGAWSFILKMHIGVMYGQEFGSEMSFRELLRLTPRTDALLNVPTSAHPRPTFRELLRHIYHICAQVLYSKILLMREGPRNPSPRAVAWGRAV